MFSVQMCMLCTEPLCEILPNDLEHAELLLEDLVSQILLDLFAAVIIDEVNIRFASDSPQTQWPCSVQIQASCISRSFPLSANELENLELVLEDRVSCGLVELLGEVEVESVTIMKKKTVTLPKNG